MCDMEFEGKGAVVGKEKQSPKQPKYHQIDHVVSRSINQVSINHSINPSIASKQSISHPINQSPLLHAHTASPARTHNTNTKRKRNRFPAWGSLCRLFPINLRYYQLMAQGHPRMIQTERPKYNPDDVAIADARSTPPNRRRT